MIINLKIKNIYIYNSYYIYLEIHYQGYQNNPFPLLKII
jgi:hypothetical protein